MPGYRTEEPRPEDRSRLVRAAARIGGSRYASKTRRWLASAPGKVLYAALGRQVIGLVHLVPLSRDELWLEGMRIHSPVRGRGLGHRFARDQIAWARSRGYRWVRLATRSDNEIIRHVMTAEGFCESGPWWRMVGSPFPPSPTDSVKQASIDQLQSIWDFLNNHQDHLASGGLATSPQSINRYQRLSPDLLLDRVRRGLVLLSDPPSPNGVLLLASEHKPGYLSVLQLVAAEPDTARGLLSAAHREAANLGRALAISIYRPDPLVVSAMQLQEARQIMRTPLQTWVVFSLDLATAGQGGAAGQ
ncbi:MAG: GNAT family N-acetyltransferase [Bacillota bacterium]